MIKGEKEYSIMNQLTKFYKGKNVLVTGGAGFIGSHLVEKLVELGSHVTVLDNFSSGKLSNLGSVLNHITLIYADITSHYSVLKATLNKDYIFHLAAMVSIPHSLRYPELCHKINVDGTVNILDGCRQHHVKRLIFASSSAIYGDRIDVCCEDDEPNPLTPYAQSKLDSEGYCKHFSTKYGIQTSSLRYFNVYGERQNPLGDYAGVIAKFKRNLLSNNTLTIYGNGQQTRDFIHVSQVVDANLKIALAQTNPGETFNVGTGKSINLLELINNLEKELNVKRKDVIFKESRTFDILHSKANCSKYEKAITNL